MLFPPFQRRAVQSSAGEKETTWGRRCAAQTFSFLFYLAPLVVLQDAPHLGAFKAEQLQAMALMLFELYVKVKTIFTLDQRDFSVYRGSRRHAFEIVPAPGE
jgi:hypothetical protein